MLIGSMCSGYDGLALALEPHGHTVAWVAEIDPDASTVLAHHWPDAPNLGNVREVDWGAVPHVDIVVAGYPCQPFSHAGRRLGEADPRHLWPDIADAVRRLGPAYVVLENVAAHLGLGFGTVLGDLADQGFDAEWGVLPASAVGAPHKRARLWVVAAHPGRVRGRQLTGGPPPPEA